VFLAVTSWWAPWLLAVTSICAVAALWALWTRRFRWARVAAAGQVGCILLGWGFAQFPYLVVLFPSFG
jgi:cytochrome d ubiquinol oxidase subunit II